MINTDSSGYNGNHSPNRRESEEAIEVARKQVADAVGANPKVRGGAG